MGDLAVWVLLAYRLPREPSTPRIAVWRKLRRLGVAQLLDGLAGLPLDSRNRERLEWIAEEVIEAGGTASVWLARPATAAQERALTAGMSAAVTQEYLAVTAAARAAQTEPPAPRALRRLRRELARIRQRDYFPPPEREQAQRAVEALAAALEPSS